METCVGRCVCSPSTGQCLVRVQASHNSPSDRVAKGGPVRSSEVLYARSPESRPCSRTLPIESAVAIQALHPRGAGQHRGYRDVGIRRNNKAADGALQRRRRQDGHRLEWGQFLGPISVAISTGRLGGSCPFQVRRELPWRVRTGVSVAEVPPLDDAPGGDRGGCSLLRAEGRPDPAFNFGHRTARAGWPDDGEDRGGPSKEVSHGIHPVGHRRGDRWVHGIPAGLNLPPARRRGCGWRRSACGPGWTHRARWTLRTGWTGCSWHTCSTGRARRTCGTCRTGRSGGAGATSRTGVSLVALVTLFAALPSLTGGALGTGCSGRTRGACCAGRSGGTAFALFARRPWGPHISGRTDLALGSTIPGRSGRPLKGLEFDRVGNDASESQHDGRRPEDDKEPGNPDQRGVGNQGGPFTARGDKRPVNRVVVFQSAIGRVQPTARCLCCDRPHRGRTKSDEKRDEEEGSRGSTDRQK